MVDRATWAKGDFNGDRVVNLADLGILAANWQKQLDLTLLEAGEEEDVLAVGTAAAHEVDDAVSAPAPASRSGRGVTAVPPERADDRGWGRVPMGVPQPPLFSASRIFEPDTEGEEEVLVRLGKTW
jgi:hypothetical protein